MGNQFPISKGVELVQCLWLLLLKVCSYFHKIEEDNFVAQWRTVNQNWELHSEIVEENKVFYIIMLIRRWLVDFWFKQKMWADFCHFWPTNCVEFFCKLCIKIRKYILICLNQNQVSYHRIHKSYSSPYGSPKWFWTNCTFTSITPKISFSGIVLVFWH